MQRLDLYFPALQAGKEKTQKRRGGRICAFGEGGAEQRTRLEISSWQPFLGRVIRIYL